MTDLIQLGGLTIQRAGPSGTARPTGTTCATSPRSACRPRTFPNARYLFAQAELAFWTERMRETPNPALVDSVLPVIAANRAVLVTADHVVDEHVRFLPTPGHTPNHLSVLLGAAGPGAVLTGDALHSPLQVAYPELSYAMDIDPALAGRTRRGLLERISETGAFCCTAHFPAPSVARIERSGDGFRCT